MASERSSAGKFVVALFGGGTVGGGVVEIVKRQRDLLRHVSDGGCEVVIKTIVVRNTAKARDFDTGRITLTTDVEATLADPDIDCVVECIGGTDVAARVVLDALLAGKHVVTANKALLAKHMDDVVAQAIRSGSQLGFEAAVAGGIPIIRALQTSLLTDRVSAIQGILNGTSNFILDLMQNPPAGSGAEITYAVALKEAQAKGYAEADPTSDVGGFDAQFKLAILMRLAFGATVPDPAVIPTVGIDCVVSEDFKLLAMAGMTVRHIAAASIDGDAGAGPLRIKARVSPCAVALDSQFALTKGPGNAVVVNSDFVGSSSFSGPGAGRYATANSVVADIAAIAAAPSALPKPFPRPAPAAGVELVGPGKERHRFYVRCVAERPDDARAESKDNVVDGTTAASAGFFSAGAGKWLREGLAAAGVAVGDMYTSGAAVATFTTGGVSVQDIKRALEVTSEAGAAWKVKVRAFPVV